MATDLKEVMYDCFGKMASPIRLYVSVISPPSRAAWMTCEAAGVECTVTKLNLLKGENKADWYIKVGFQNPSVPPLFSTLFHKQILQVWQELV